MIVLTILVPVADNDGRKFLDRELSLFESYATDLFGGITRLPGEAAGRWNQDGRHVPDRLLVFKLALASITQGDKVAELVAFAKLHFAQDAIYLEYLGIAEIL